MELSGDYIVAFDNNAYGDLVEGRSISDIDGLIATLRSEEIRAGAEPLASPLVMMELVALLEDRTLLAYNPAYLAIVALWEHTKKIVAGELRLGSLSDPASMMCDELFGETPAKNRETLDIITQVCTYVGRDRPTEIPSEVHECVVAVATHVRKIEAEFVDQLFELVVKALNPNAVGWAPLKGNRQAQAEAVQFLRSPESHSRFGRMQVDRCLTALDKDLSPTDRAEAGDFLAKKLAVGATLFNEILIRIVTTGCNLEKKNRRNWVWDLNIALGVGRDHSIQNKSVHLVTSDSDIIEAAKKTGCSNLVRRYSEYRQNIAS